MLFPTLAFHLFFIVVFALAWLLRGSNEWRKIMLLVASWVFYGAWDWRFVALLIISGLINWGAARWIIAAHDRQRQRKAILVAGVAANLCILGFFKYYGFFVEQLSGLLHQIGWQRDLPILEIILPVGVSFFTFQGMSYLIDIYNRKTDDACLLDLTLLMSFFPHLVAGPIVRASHLIPQFKTVPTLTRSMVAAALGLIIWGVFKKAVIASTLSIHFVDPVFFDPAAHGSLDLLMAAYGYAVQIYCDFSAYSDIAIGLAALLGYRFPRNFDQPYRAASLQDFWRRWHISLSSWLRDYLYIALGGSRHGLFRLCLALGATMVMGGLWHGASWNFVIWGALHGLVLATERIWRAYRPATWPTMPDWVTIFTTFHVVTLAWIFFRCASFADAKAYITALFSLNQGIITASPLILFFIMAGLGLHAAPKDMMQRIAIRCSALRAWQVAVIATAMLLVIEAMRPDGVAPFIYYQF